jgi:hypothetical protein
MIINALSYIPEIPIGLQAAEIKQVNFSPCRAARKKKDQNFEVSLQKLLKTHVEKMSTFESVQKLLITKVFKVFLKVCI